MANITPEYAGRRAVIAKGQQRDYWRVTDSHAQPHPCFRVRVSVDDMTRKKIKIEIYILYSLFNLALLPRDTSITLPVWVFYNYLSG